MRRLALTAAILLATAHPALANDHAAEQLVMDSGHKPADLFQGKGNSFDLEIDFTAQRRVPLPGHFSLKWQSRDHWWSKVSVGSFEQSLVRNGEMEDRVRNLGYTPTMVQDLLGLLGFDGSSSGYVATSQKSRTVDGIATTCVEAQNSEFKNDDRDFCFAIDSHQLLREDWEAGQGEKDIEIFAEYSTFDGTAYPRKLQLFRNGEESISANVATLASAAFDPALLVPAKGAIARRKCPGMQPPVPIKRFQPVVNQPGFEGSMAASLTILTDGSVGDVEIIRSGGPAMDKASAEAFKKFTFKPAMCGADPVVTDTEISVTIRHR